MSQLSIPTIAVTVFIGLLSAAICALAGAAIAMVAAGVLHMSNMEGARGYFGAACGIIGGVAGLILGMVFALRWRGVSGAGPIFAGTAVSVVSVLVVAGLGLAAYYYGRPRIVNPNGSPPYLHFEIMAPAGVAFDFTGDVELQTDRNTMPAYWDREKKQVSPSGETVLSGYVEMYYISSHRNLVLTMLNGEVKIFQLRLPGDPTASKYQTWSEWRKADYTGAKESAPKRVADAREFQIRYFVDPNR